MKSFPTIKTDRLVLRKMELSDIPDLMKYVNNKIISDNIINIPYLYLEEDAIARFHFVLQGFKNEERYVFAITKKNENKLIGEIGIHLDNEHNRAEIGYWIGEPFWGLGIATEAVKSILQFGFNDLNLNKIYATHYVDNPASGKVLVNNKMILEAELKDQYKMNDTYKSVFQYRLTRSEFLNLS